ncbi:hypothetical protein BpHYR1_051029 [Brachionus plicatilis]|uniref:Uncharacterized protein n=1 Tax=Brachionus plicatilis TaxID=10195 RepID=A0A3M7SQD5_BRAPC|nr:hypothetical protein BpHYR1_051029 [Brachionus plicatilis]
MRWLTRGRTAELERCRLRQIKSVHIINDGTGALARLLFDISKHIIFYIILIFSISFLAASYNFKKIVLQIFKSFAKKDELTFSLKFTCKTDLLKGLTNELKKKLANLVVYESQK